MRIRGKNFSKNASNSPMGKLENDQPCLSAMRVWLPPASPVRSDQDIVASLSDTLSKLNGAGDVWVFGYGSLIWNPEIEYDETRFALLR